MAELNSRCCNRNQLAARANMPLNQKIFSANSPTCLYCMGEKFKQFDLPKENWELSLGSLIHI